MDFLQHTHELVIVTAHPCGDEEWYCPVCSEHFVLRMPCQPCQRAAILPVIDWDDPTLAPWRVFLETLAPEDFDAMG